MSNDAPRLTRETAMWHVIDAVEGGDLDSPEHDIDGIVDAIHAETGTWDPAKLTPQRWRALVAEHTLSDGVTAAS